MPQDFFSGDLQHALGLNSSKRGAQKQKAWFLDCVWAGLVVHLDSEEQACLLRESIFPYGVARHVSVMGRWRCLRPLLPCLICQRTMCRKSYVGLFLNRTGGNAMLMVLCSRGCKSCMLSPSHHCFALAKLNADWSVIITHTYRETNTVADWLASYAFSYPIGVHRICRPTPKCIPLLWNAFSGVRHVRRVLS